MLVLQDLLDGGDSPNIIVGLRRLPLIMACEIGELDAVKILVKGGADINLFDKGDENALMDKPFCLRARLQPRRKRCICSAAEAAEVRFGLPHFLFNKPLEVVQLHLRLWFAISAFALSIWEGVESRRASILHGTGRPGSVATIAPTMARRVKASSCWSCRV